MGYGNVKVSVEQGGSVLNVEDGALVNFGDSDDAAMGWNTTSTDRLKLTAAANNTRFDIGTAALSFDVNLYGSASTLSFDASANTIDFDGMDFNLQDDDLLAFGDSNDVTMEWDTATTADFLVSAAANNTPITLGTAAKSFDVSLYGSAGTIIWDASADTLDFNAADLNLQDDDLLALGDANDATIAWSTTSTDRLIIKAAANNSRFDIGTAALSYDVYLYGSAGTVAWDASANLLDINSSKLDLNNSTGSVQFYLAPALSTANVGPGGFRMYTNSTTVFLAVNMTGTTWKTMALN